MPDLDGSNITSSVMHKIYLQKVNVNTKHYQNINKLHENLKKIIYSESSWCVDIKIGKYFYCTSHSLKVTKKNVNEISAQKVL